jgi:hypothetical protein
VRSLSMEENDSGLSGIIRGEAMYAESRLTGLRNSVEAVTKKEETPQKQVEEVAEQTVVETKAPTVKKPIGEQLLSLLTSEAYDAEKHGSKYDWLLSTNWVKAHFSARKVKEKSVFDATNDFFNGISKETDGKAIVDTASPVFEEILGKPLSEKEATYVKALARFHTLVSAKYQELKKPENVYRNKNAFYQLTDADGNLAPNVMAAISVTLFEWVGSSMEGLSQNELGEIRSMLGIGKDAPLHINDALNLLQDAGSPAQSLYQTLGKSIYKTLGIEPTTEAQRNMEPKLIAAIGQMSVGILADMNLIKQTNVPRSALNALTNTDLASFYEKLDSVEVDFGEEVEGTGTRQVVPFFSPVLHTPTDPQQGYASPIVKVAIEHVKDSPAFVKELFFRFQNFIIFEKSKN